MVDRRRFLGAAALGLAGGRLLAREPEGPTPFHVPTAPDERVNRILEAARTGGRRLPGMVGAVVRGEEVTAIGAVGIRKIGSPEPIRVDDVVHLGSCTKAMTATMIGTLVDEGKLGWETTLAITDFAFIDSYSSAAIEAARARGASAAEVAALAPVVRPVAQPAQVAAEEHRRLGPREEARQRQRWGR